MLKIKKIRDVVNAIYNSEENQKIRKKMTKFLKYYTGEFWEGQEKRKPEDAAIVINILFSTIMTVAPMMTDNKPIWNILARFPYFQSLADIFKIVGDCLYDMQEMQDKIFRWCLDAFIMKMGYMKVFFDPNAETYYNGEIAHEIIDPRTFIIAPGYDDPWEAPWCGTKTRRSLDWAHKHFPEHKKEIKSDEADSSMWDKFSKKESYELGNQFCNIYEIWIRDEDENEYFETIMKDGEEKKEKRKGKSKNGSWILTFCDSYDEPLERKPYPYNHGKAPYVPLYDYIVPHEHIGMGEIDQLETINLEINYLAKVISKHCHLWSNPNWLLDGNSGLNDTQIKAELPGGGNVWVTNPGGNWPPFIAALPPQLQSIVLEFLSSLMKVAEEISGVTDITKGMTSKKQRQSAHEISALLETSYTRTRQRVRNLEWSLKRVFQLDVELMQQYYTENRTYSQKNKDGTMEWFNISNRPQFAIKATQPNIPEGEQPNEEDQMKMQQVVQLVEFIGKDETVYFPFQITIETNSTLPMDKQSLANMAMELAQLQITPNSGLDHQSLLETIQWPRAEQVIERQTKAQEAAMKLQQGGEQ